MMSRGGKSHIGLILRALRLERGWDQEALAANSGVSQTHISGIEVGRHRNPGVQTLAKLASALGVSVAAFFPELEGAKGVAEALAQWGEEGPPTAEEKEFLALLRDTEMGKEVRRQMKLLKLAQAGRQAPGRDKKVR